MWAWTFSRLATKCTLSVLTTGAATRSTVFFVLSLRLLSSLALRHGLIYLVGPHLSEVMVAPLFGYGQSIIDEVYKQRLVEQYIKEHGQPNGGVTEPPAVHAQDDA